MFIWTLGVVNVRYVAETNQIKVKINDVQEVFASCAIVFHINNLFIIMRTHKCTLAHFVVSKKILYVRWIGIG